MKVIGMVNKNTKPFISACDRFIFMKFRWCNKEKAPKHSDTKRQSKKTTVKNR
jgi:hypothetical protein